MRRLSNNNFYFTNAPIIGVVDSNLLIAIRRLTSINIDIGPLLVSSLRHYNRVGNWP